MTFAEWSVYNFVGYTMAFTGRRPKDLCGWKEENYLQFIEELKQIVLLAYNRGIRRFITGGAQGFDQMAFWAVNWLRMTYPEVENIVYIPFIQQYTAWSKYGCFSQDEYKVMLNEATSYYVLMDINPDNRWEIDEAYKYRNHMMVNGSDCLLGLYPDDTWTYNKGGTSECLRYAKKVNKPTTLLRYEITSDNILMPTTLEPIVA